jgi:hypothetical protein
MTLDNIMNHRHTHRVLQRASMVAVLTPGQPLDGIPGIHTSQTPPKQRHLYISNQEKNKLPGNDGIMPGSQTALVRALTEAADTPTFAVLQPA